VDCKRGPKSDKKGFSDLLTELRVAFDREGFLLSAAVSPNKAVIDAGTQTKQYDITIMIAIKYYAVMKQPQWRFSFAFHYYYY